MKGTADSPSTTENGVRTGRADVRSERQRKAARAAENEKVDIIDFKMVTFSLGGKDYGIDIMKVKEIAKFTHFTYVPNCPPFVRGVYNLRGEIISVIDLRKMFNLPAEDIPSKTTENGLILRLENTLIGIIVDFIDKVVGISKDMIQPPHPIFADINIKYISGVVENDNRLYIILDADRIFTRETDRMVQSAAAREEESEPENVEILPVQAETPESGEGLTLGFIFEQLSTFASFHVTELNRVWVERRFVEWENTRGGGRNNAQLTSIDDTESFLETFYSEGTSEFWNEQETTQVLGLLGERSGVSLNVWNPGCGKGFEAYSVACAVRKKLPKARLKIWASDRDLLNISTAPNLIFRGDQVPEPWRDFTASGKNGYSFKQEIKDLILFEYHDILNRSALPDIDLIVARDLLSFLKPEDQQRVINDFYEHLKDHGLLVLGTNERLPESDRWKLVGDKKLSAYRKM